MVKLHVGIVGTVGFVFFLRFQNVLLSVHLTSLPRDIVGSTFDVVC
jgi:hypothetical protein